MKKLCKLLLVFVLLCSIAGIICVFAEGESGGDLSKLNVPKYVYEYDEPILISAIGSGENYVGIYFPDDPYSLRWVYIDATKENGVGSGVEFDIKTAGFDGSNSCQTFPVGEYEIKLKPNDNLAATAWVKIKIVPPADAPVPEKPVSATYEIKNPGSGYAEGTLTVTVSETEVAKNIVPYWANENGILEEYTALAKFKVKGTENVFEFPKGQIIPEGATKLRIYVSNFFDQRSEEYYEIDLPKDSGYKDPGEPIAEFQVVSDIHIVESNSHIHTEHYIAMLNDIAANSKNSIGIFMVGDMTDNGKANEYKKLESLHQSVEGLPPYFMAVGNHDLWGGTLAEKNKVFLKYAKLPDGSNPESTHYDFWLNGYHFVFLGNDNLVNMIDCTLSDETLAWLDKTLAEDRDKNRPTFLFIHQGMYNTVAGTLSGEGWHGLVNSSEIKLKLVLKKYPEVVMFNGHSHWDLDSKRNMYPAKSSMPNIFNTAAVGYLCSVYNSLNAERVDGSEGYYVRVYEDKILVLGREFVEGKWSANTQFAIEIPNGTGPKKSTVSFDTAGIGTKPDDAKVNPGEKVILPTISADGYIFEGWFTDSKFKKEFDPESAIDADITLYAKWSEAPVPTPTPTEETPSTTAEPTTAPQSNNGIVIVIIVSAVAVVVIGVVVAVVVITKKKKK